MQQNMKKKKMKERGNSLHCREKMKLSRHRNWKEVTWQTEELRRRMGNGRMKGNAKMQMANLGL